MGCGSSIGKTLSSEARQLIDNLFGKIDEDGDGNITRQEAQKFFKSFGKVNAKALFDEVDDDDNNSLSKAEFMGFWEQVRTAGYTNKEISEELQLMMDGGDWVNWKDGRDVKADTKTKPNSKPDQKAAENKTEATTKDDAANKTGAEEQAGQEDKDAKQAEAAKVHFEVETPEAVAAKKAEDSAAAAPAEPEAAAEKAEGESVPAEAAAAPQEAADIPAPAQDEKTGEETPAAT